MNSHEVSSDRSDGPVVGCLSSYVPRELLYSLDCTPVRVWPKAAKPTAAEAYLPRNFCSLSKLVLATFLEAEPPHLEAAIFTDEDDATRRLHDVWVSCVKVPVWGFLEAPRSTSSLAVSRFTGLLTGLARDLEQRTGQLLSVRRLRAAMTVYREQRRLLAELKRRWPGGKDHNKSQEATDKGLAGCMWRA